MHLQLQRLLILAAIGIAVFMLAPPTSPVLGGGTMWSSASKIVDEQGATPEPKATSEPRELPKRRKAKGILMTGYTVGGSRFGDLVRMIERTELNAVVIDIKDESGEISWNPRTPGVRTVGAGRNKIREPARTIRTLRNRGIYVIGRIVTMQDPVLSEARPDLAVRDTAGGAWTNNKDLGWVDPYSEEVWEYNLALAKEAVSLGFEEIQFDYIRFPSDGDVDRIWYAHEDARTPTQVITSFFDRARTEIHPLGAYVSADIFGFMALATDDQGIGQEIEHIAREIDYLSLMIYPSHFSKGNYGLRDPEASPAETISRSLTDAKRRTKGTTVTLRPWLQDFSLRVPYTPREVRAQIEAAEALGVDQWLLWNATNRYSEDALRPAR